MALRWAQRLHLLHFSSGRLWAFGDDSFGDYHQLLSLHAQNTPPSRHGLGTFDGTVHTSPVNRTFSQPRRNPIRRELPKLSMASPYHIVGNANPRPLLSLSLSTCLYQDQDAKAVAAAVVVAKPQSISLQTRQRVSMTDSRIR